MSSWREIKLRNKLQLDDLAAKVNDKSVVDLSLSSFHEVLLKSASISSVEKNKFPNASCNRDNPTFQEKETVIYKSADSKEQQAEIIKIHTEDRDFINYTIKISDQNESREINTLSSRLHSINSSSSSSSCSMNFNKDSDVLGVHVYNQCGSQFTSNFHGNISFKNIKEEVFENSHHDQSVTSNKTMSHDHVEDIQNDNISDDEASAFPVDDYNDDDDTSVKSVLSCQSQNSTMSEGELNRKKRSSDEEMKVEAYSQSYEETTCPCKCSEVGCAAYLHIKQVVILK